MNKPMLGIILFLLAANIGYAGSPESPKSGRVATGDERTGLIQPFGGLSWEDGLEAAINHLNGMGGVEKIVLGNGIYGHSENIKGKSGNELRALLIKSYGRFTEDGDFANPDLSKAKCYIDSKGSKIPFHECQPAEITVFPVTICDVPFEMKLEYVYSPGLAYQYPGRVIAANDGKNDYSISLVLRKVNLSGLSPISAAKLNEIKKMILGNYAGFRGGLRDDVDSIWGKVADSHGTIFSVDVGKTGGFISYSSGYFDARLDEEYRTHRAN